MHSDHPEVRPHKNKHAAEKFEGLLGTLMVVAIVVLAIGMVYAIATGDFDAELDALTPKPAGAEAAPAVRIASAIRRVTLATCGAVG